MSGMSVVLLILIILVCAGAWWLVAIKFKDKIVQPFRWVLLGIILAVALYYLLVSTGLWDLIWNIRTPHVR